MKFVCGECQAKYQIPDERVAGRKLKIRCRKCGAAIHLRGENASAVGEPAPTLEWHVAVDGEQHGPYPTDQMASLLRDGHLGWDVSVWRDGYADWKDADTSDTLVRAVASIAETRYSSPPEYRSSTPSIAPEYDDEDLTRSFQNGPAPDELPTRMVHHAFPDEEVPTRMVQHAPAQRAASFAPVAAIAAVQARPASVSPAAGLAAARHPASYAPTAGLAPVQSRSPSVVPLRAPAPSASAFAPPAPVRTADLSYAVAQLSAAPAQASVRSGYASGEGSGLIDIRALSALTHAGSSRPAPMAVTNNRWRGTTPGEGLAPRVAPNSPFGNVDSLAPFERPPQRGSSKALPIAIVVGSSIVAAAAILVVFMTRRDAAAAAAVPAVAPVVAAASALPAAEPELAAAPAEAPGLPTAEAPSAELAAAAAPKAADDEPADVDQPSEPARASRSSSSRASSKGKTSTKASAKADVGAAKAKVSEDKKDEEVDDLLAKPAEAPAAPAPEKAASPSIDDLLEGKDKAAPAAAEGKPKPPPVGSRSIDELLAGAVVKKGAAAPAAGASNLPESPGRDEVKSAMQGMESDVKACAAGQELESPTATVAVTISGSSGRVQSVRVTGNQGVVGSCIARVVRGAKFSPFSKPQFTFNFPYKLK